MMINFTHANTTAETQPFELNKLRSKARTPEKTGKTKSMVT